MITIQIKKQVLFMLLGVFDVSLRFLVNLNFSAFNNSSYIAVDNFMKTCRKCTNEIYSFLFNNATLPSNNLRFRKDNPLRFGKTLIYENDNWQKKIVM